MEKDTKSNLQADTAVTQPEKASEIAEYTNSGIKAPPKLTLFALTLATALSLFGILEPEAFMETTQEMNHAFMMAAGHWVVIIGSLFMLSCFILAFSPLGRIRLGAPDSTPEFSTLSWLSMLFAAGMGSGLLFWGVAEPIMHFASPPPLNGAMETAGAARMALVITYLHWTLHPWGIYASGALCIAYFSFCKGHSLLPSAPFRAALPKRFRISQAAGDIVDVTCVISMLLGLSAAMAMGTMQIASGTIVLGNTATDGGMIPTYLAIVGLLVAVYMLSASTSINKGIKRLSEINMLLVVLLAILIMFGTSVSQSISTLFQALIDFTRFLPELLFTPLGAEKQPEWNETWTANYFLSWIAWVPFVGIFVARISRGRTIREFVMGVIIAPSLFSFLWFAVLGGASIDAQLAGTLDLVGDIENDPGSGLFSLLNLFPSPYYLWCLVVVGVFIFLVTSADSASYVLAMMAGRGEENPSVKSKLFWGMAIAVLTASSLFSESGIHAVRAVFSFAGIAVFFILIAQMLCLFSGLARHNK